MTITANSRIGERLLASGSFFELTAKNSDGTGFLQFVRAPQTLPLLFGLAQRNGDKPFIADELGSETYAGVFNKARRLGTVLIEKCGLRPGMKVAIRLTPSVSWVVAFIAITIVGATAVLEEPEKANSEDAGQVASDYTITDLDGSPLICQYDKGVPTIVGEIDTLITYETRQCGPQPTATGSDAIIAFTSGTTGMKKAVRVSHRALMSGVMNTALASALSAAERGPQQAASPRTGTSVFSLAPLTHVGGYTQMLLLMLLGARLHVRQNLQMPDLFDVLKRNSITSIQGVSIGQVADILQNISGGDVEHVRTIVSNGEAMPPPLLRRVKAHWPQITPTAGYGLTESSGLISLLAGDRCIEEPYCRGRVVPSVECVVWDELEREVPPGVNGRIMLRGEMLYSGYIGRLGARDAWFDTGDQGTMQDGVLSLSGRKSDDADIRSGIVSSQDIEWCIYELAGIRECAAVNNGSEINVYASGRCDPNAMERHLFARYPTLKGVLTAAVLPELPRTSSNKLDRKFLRCYRPQLGRSAQAI